MRERTWEAYRARGVRDILKLLREDDEWTPSPEQRVWLRKYATDAEKLELAEEGILL